MEGGLHEFKIANSQIWSPFKNGDDSTIAKSLLSAIFIKVKETLFSVINKVKILSCQLSISNSVVLRRSKGCRGVDAKGIDIDCYVIS